MPVTVFFFLAPLPLLQQVHAPVLVQVHVPVLVQVHVPVPVQVHMQVQVNRWSASRGRAARTVLVQQLHLLVVAAVSSNVARY